MNIFGINFGGKDNTRRCGEETVAMLQEQGYTDETTNYRMLRQVAEEHGLDSIDLCLAVHDTLSGNVWCPNCRCTQPAQHVCFD